MKDKNIIIIGISLNESKNSERINKPNGKFCILTPSRFDFTGFELKNREAKHIKKAKAGKYIIERQTGIEISWFGRKIISFECE